MAARYDFVQLDVLPQTPLAGNPLAIFTDARDLTDKQMQGLAHEMESLRNNLHPSTRTGG